MNKFVGIDLLFIILFFSFFLAQIFTFLINDYFDREHDKLSDKKRLRNIFCSESQKIVNIALIMTIGSFFLSLFLAITISFEIFLLVFFYQIITLQYSSPPFRIKDHPPFDILIHGFALSIVSIAGFIYFFSANDLMFYIFILALILGIIPQIGQQVSDFKVDKLSFQSTSTTLIGKVPSLILLRTIVGVSIFWLIYMTYLFSFGNLPIIVIILTLLTLLYLFARDYKKERIILALEVGLTLFFL